MQGAVLYLTSLALGAYFINEYAQSFGLAGMGPGVSTMTIAFGWYFLQVCLLFLAFGIGTLVLLTADGQQIKSRPVHLTYFIPPARKVLMN